jgi:hypothetical protein
MKRLQNKTERSKDLLFFLGSFALVLLYLAFIVNSFDVLSIIHKTDGEELFYTVQLPKIISKEQSELIYPFFRIGLPTVGLMTSSITGLPIFNAILATNFLLYLLFGTFLYWIFLPKLSKNPIKPVLKSMLFLLVMTNPVFVKYIFSIHPDFILFVILLVMCYVMIALKDHTAKFFAILLLTMLLIIFKEAAIFMAPFFVLYFIDEYGISRKSLIYSLSFIIAIGASYFFIYKLLFSNYSQFILNKELFVLAPFSYRIANIVSNLMKNGILFTSAAMIYKIQFNYGLLWVFMLLKFIKLQRFSNALNKIKNYIYLLYPLPLFILLSLSTGIGEKYIFYFSILPYFYLFMIKYKFDAGMIKNNLAVFWVLLFNLANLVVYFMIQTKLL